MIQAPAPNEVPVTHGTIIYPSHLDFHALGLAGCIDRLTEPLRREGTAVRWETPHHGIDIPAASAILLYHAAQETIRNAHRHAKPTELTIRIAAVYHGVRLVITDSGSGFDMNAIDNRNRGFGLPLMSIAVREANGTITIDSIPGSGTRVTITLPLD